jgi:hypothetical protein
MSKVEVALTSSSTQVASVVRTALLEFRANLSRPELLNFSHTSYEDLCREIVRIQNEQDELKSMNNISRIQNCVEMFSEFGKVVELFMSASDVAPFIWGPMKHSLLVCHLIPRLGLQLNCTTSSKVSAGSKCF